MAEQRRSEVIVGNEGDSFLGDGAGGLTPSGSLPIIFAFVIGNPGWDGLTEMASKSEDVRLVHLTEFAEFLAGDGSAVEGGAMLRKFEAKLFEDLRRQAVRFWRSWGRSKNLAQVHDGVTGNSKGEFSLFGAGAFEAGDNDGTGVQDGGKRADPGLIVVLRAEVGQDGIRKVRLEQLGAPDFPGFQ